jgi:hypothetical protein
MELERSWGWGGLRYNSDVMAMIGTILNWMTFPSFNAYFAPAHSQQGVVVNTYLSLFRPEPYSLFLFIFRPSECTGG